MSGISNKNTRDQPLFQGFLNDLQDWEQTFKERDKNLKGQVHGVKKGGSSIRKKGNPGDEKGLPRKAPTADVKKPYKAVDSKIPHGSNNGLQSDYLRSLDAISHVSSNLFTEESPPDAASEKELGNECFKQKKFMEAIVCYSRSIALSPSSVAFANRAMAYLKIKRFEEAESDCTEALSLDDRYVKAYSRRATARKELGKFRGSMEDSEFALRLEPNNQELQKLYAETKALYEKEMVKKTPSAVKNSIPETQRIRIQESEVKDSQEPHFISQSSRSTGALTVQSDQSEDCNGANHSNLSDVMKETKSGGVRAETVGREQVSEGLQEVAIAKSHADIYKKNHDVNSKHGLKPSVQDLASRAASRTMEAAAKSIRAPRSAYQFEVLWRGFSDDRGLQILLLKTISPATLPQLFKNALSAPILIDIVECIGTCFVEEMDFSVSILDNLAKVGRFEMIVMCLSAAERSDIRKVWDEVFSNAAVPIEHAEILSRLRSKYCPGP